MKRILLTLILVGLFITIIAGTACATKWREIPFSFGGAYIDTDSVFEDGNIMSFWFMTKKAEKPGTYQDTVTNKKDSWTYQDKRFTTCVRKVEVNFVKDPREVRSAFAIYLDAKGRQIGNPESSNEDGWTTESGPRLWTDLLRKVLAKEGRDTGIPSFIIGK